MLLLRLRDRNRVRILFVGGEPGVSFDDSLTLTLELAAEHADGAVLAVSERCDNEVCGEEATDDARDDRVELAFEEEGVEDVVIMTSISCLHCQFFQHQSSPASCASHDV